MQEKKPIHAIIIVSSLGIQFAVSLFLGYFIGSYLDDRFHSGQMFLIIGILAGLGAGVIGAAKLIKPFLYDDD